MAGALLLLAACRGPAPAPPVDPSLSAGRAAPAWVGTPLSWARLDEIETWLASEGERSEPYWRIEGELALAEGRLRFARTDLGQRAGVRSARLAERLAAAVEGFRSVLREPLADSRQLARARRGLREAEGLGAPAPEPSAGSGGAAGLSVVPRSAWGAAPPIRSRLDPVGGTWQRITVHHSAEVPGIVLDGSRAHSIDALRKIQHHHQANNGWGDIGYHFLIDPAGRIFEGRELAWQGAHAGGANNVRNLGICLLGDFRSDRPSDEALAALDGLLSRLCANYEIPRSQVRPHSVYKNTACPGRTLGRWVVNWSRGGARAATASLLRARPREALAHRSAAERRVR